MQRARPMYSLPKPQIKPPYSMNHASRGTVLIFNNAKYKPRYEDRLFSIADVAKLTGAFKGLGYKDIQLKSELKAEEMLTEIRKVAEKDHTHCDSVVVVFLAYGEHNVVHAKDRAIGIQILLDPLKGDVCHRSLIGKPKVVILQTCNPTMEYVANGPEDEKKVQVIPTEADFVFMGSEMPGLVTGRKIGQGSIFIDHLCRNLQAGKKEIRQVMTRTLADVKEEVDGHISDWQLRNDAFLPYFISMLTRDLYIQAAKAV